MVITRASRCTKRPRKAYGLRARPHGLPIVSSSGGIGAPGRASCRHHRSMRHARNLICIDGTGAFTSGKRTLELIWSLDSRTQFYPALATCWRGMDESGSGDGSRLIAVKYRILRPSRARAILKRAESLLPLTLTVRHRTFQISLRGGFILQRQNFIRIDPHHQIADVIVDLGEPVSRPGRNHDHVAWP